MGVHLVASATRLVGGRGVVTPQTSSPITGAPPTRVARCARRRVGMVRCELGSSPSAGDGLKGKPDHARGATFKRKVLADRDPVMADPVATEALLGLKDVVPQVAAHLEVTRVDDDAVEVVCGPARLRVDAAGKITLWRVEAFNHRVVARAALSLPEHARPPLWQWEVAADGEHAASLTMSWGPSVGCQITPAASNARDEKAWPRGLFDGFLFEYSVEYMPHHAAQAELVVDMDTSGWWFGGSHLMRQHWPLNTGSWEVGPHYPFDNGPHGLNTLVSSHWMTSNGLLCMLDPDTPYLHVGFNAPRQGGHDGFVQRSWGVGIQNMSREYLPADAHTTTACDGLLRLQTRADYRDFDIEHPMGEWETSVDHLHSCAAAGAAERPADPPRRLTLRAALCTQSNVRAAAQMALAAMPQPGGAVPEDFIRAPIWTTWARYGAKVTQTKVLAFAEEITARAMARSVMEIDDKWQSKYGDLQFDERKFPDPTGMVKELHEAGFKVTLWVTPFFEAASDMFKEGAPLGYFCTSLEDPDEPGFFPWWNSPDACALDVTNPQATQWFVSKLKALQAAHGIDGYKFDAGEPCFLPRRFATHASISSPSEYTRLYVQRVAAHFPLCEVRTGHLNQDLSLFTRMGDRFSTWGLSNGLRSMIPTLLTSGLAGYPFCLPDMIGGNGYFGKKPDMELMVRWAQANALMPAMQFSIAPWDLSAEADVLCQQALELRNTFVEQILALGREAGQALEPICRPMWWLDPEDEETFQIRDQFVVGDTVIVAPVVHQGQTRRNVYLTAGVWADMEKPSITYLGGQWLHSVEAPLHKLPCFVRVDDGLEVYS